MSGVHLRKQIKVRITGPRSILQQAVRLVVHRNSRWIDIVTNQLRVQLPPNNRVAVQSASYRPNKAHQGWHNQLTDQVADILTHYRRPPNEFCVKLAIPMTISILFRTDNIMDSAGFFLELVGFSAMLLTAAELKTRVRQCIKDI